MPALILPAAARAALLAARRGAHPDEACGLLLLEDERLRATQTTNCAPTPRAAFLIDPAALLVAAVSGDLIGCWHTHPSGSSAPSAEDIDAMRSWPDLVHLVVGDAMTAWRWTSAGPREVAVHAGSRPALVESAHP